MAHYCSILWRWAKRVNGDGHCNRLQSKALANRGLTEAIAFLTLVNRPKIIIIKKKNLSPPSPSTGPVSPSMRPHHRHHSLALASSQNRTHRTDLPAHRWIRILLGGSSGDCRDPPPCSSSCRDSAVGAMPLPDQATPRRIRVPPRQIWWWPLGSTFVLL